MTLTHKQRKIFNFLKDFGKDVTPGSLAAIAIVITGLQFLFGCVDPLYTLGFCIGLVLGKLLGKYAQYQLKKHRKGLIASFEIK